MSELALSRARCRRRRPPSRAELAAVCLFGVVLGDMGLAVGFLVGRDLPNGHVGMIVVEALSVVAFLYLANEWWPIVRAIVRHWWDGE